MTTMSLMCFCLASCSRDTKGRLSAVARVVGQPTCSSKHCLLLLLAGLVQSMQKLLAVKQV